MHHNSSINYNLNPIFTGIEHTQPQAIIPTLIGTPINPEVPFFGCKEYFVGHEAMKMRGSLKLSRPIQRGVINDMEAMEQFLQCSLMNELRANASQSSILMTDKLFRYVLMPLGWLI